MLLTAIWNILSKLEKYTPDGYKLVRPAQEHKQLTTKQALALLKSRGYVIKDEAFTVA